MAIPKVFVRGPYSYDVDAVSESCGVDFDPDESIVMQSFAEECDINTIVARFGLTGVLPNGVDMPQSGDFTDVTDFHTAMNLVAQANSAFMELPAHIRARFGNDPARVIAFLDDEKNREEAVGLGIVAKPAERVRDVVVAVDELAAKLVPPSPT